ncbi:hypothetical protein NQZ79_g8869 [Umbelopsis isabellina]|nr:hypothetical protein NQZ79_g8869 [Umbelopsis isabellina]
MDWSTANIQATNNKSKDLNPVEKPVGVFVGSTSGIGEHAAYAMARFTGKPKIYIVGRNASAGERIIANLKGIQSAGTYQFLQHDLSLIKEAEKLANVILKQETKVNVLALTCGSFNMKETTTPEGFDFKQTIFLYSRWKIIDMLMPLVNRAAELGEPARVNNMLNPGRGGPVDKEYFIRRGSYKLEEMLTFNCRTANLLVMKYARMYPAISVMHTYPGYVRTNIMRDSPWYVRIPFDVMKPFLESADSSGERMHFLNYASEHVTPGGHLYTRKLNDLADIFTKKWVAH